MQLTMDNIRISCITPTFNRSQLLKKSMDSTIVQTYANWEMIIVDDGSSDNTEEVALEYAKKYERIKYFKNPGKGANAARNFGIKKSIGEFLVFLDDDDEHLPHRFESQLNAAKKNGSNFILSGYQTQDKSGNILSKNNMGLWAKGAGIGIRWFLKRDLAIRAGLFDENMPSMQEVELSYRLAEYETFANHKEIVVSAGHTPGSISKGLNGIRGKEILLQKHKNNMPPLEAAWWYFVIGMGYYSERDELNALKNLGISAELDERGIYKFAFNYAKIFFRFGSPLKKINLKVLQTLSGYKFPKLVEHKVIY